MDNVITENNGKGLLKIIINRPEKRNAISYEVMDELEYILREAKRDTAVKVLLLTGAGEAAFCSGGDLSQFHSLKTEEESYAMLSKMGAIVYTLATFPKPTAAYINGSAVGGGCELAAACDFRFAHTNGRMGFIQGTLGITTGWGGASLLFEKLPYQHALHLLMSSQVVSAQEAEEIGFVNRLLEDIEECMEEITPYLKMELGVLEAYKRPLTEKWEKQGLKERMESEIRNCAKLWESEAHQIAVERFLNKR